MCANQHRPAAALPANASRVTEFNAKVGMDVKYLPGWKPNQKVPCVNLVDFASSLQVIIPLHKPETGPLLRDALQDFWIGWAGPPKMLVMDPSKPNLSACLGDFCNNLGIEVSFTAAEASWQLGKVERHGQWFQRILQRVLDDVRPETLESYRECLSQTQSAKNTLLSEAGASPYQLVFGRNPRVPQDLLQDHPHVPAVDATEHDPVCSQAHSVRQVARKAMLECQDDRALRAALRARPRPARDFQSGDWVYYWRSQKWINGVKVDGGQWYGAALVLGKLGRNLVVAHRRSILRCAPEQLRFAVPEEKIVAEFSENELLGIRNLLGKGQFPKSQFIDLVMQPAPPVPETVDSPRPERPSAGQTAAQLLASQQAAKLRDAPSGSDGSRPENLGPGE